MVLFIFMIWYYDINYHLSDNHAFLNIILINAKRSLKTERRDIFCSKKSLTKAKQYKKSSKNDVTQALTAVIKSLTPSGFDSRHKIIDPFPKFVTSFMDNT